MGLEGKIIYNLFLEFILLNKKEVINMEINGDQIIDNNQVINIFKSYTKIVTEPLKDQILYDIMTNLYKFNLITQLTCLLNIINKELKQVTVVS